jgi:hypothetical protein
MAEETGLDAVVKLVQNLGLNEELWRGYLGDQVSKKIRDTDLKDATVRVKDLAGLSAEKLKDASTRNPRLFYSGLAAIVLGAGLMARAVRDKVDALDDEFSSSGTTGTAGELRGEGLGDGVQPRAASTGGGNDDLGH